MAISINSLRAAAARSSRMVLSKSLNEARVY